MSRSERSHLLLAFMLLLLGTAVTCLVMPYVSLLALTVGLLLLGLYFVIRPRAEGDRDEESDDEPD